MEPVKRKAVEEEEDLVAAMSIRGGPALQAREEVGSLRVRVRVPDGEAFGHHRGGAMGLRRPRMEPDDLLTAMEGMQRIREALRAHPEGKAPGGDEERQRRIDPRPGRPPEGHFQGERLRE